MLKALLHSSEEPESCVFIETDYDAIVDNPMLEVVLKLPPVLSEFRS